MEDFRDERAYFLIQRTDEARALLYLDLKASADQMQLLFDEKHQVRHHYTGNTLHQVSQYQRHALQ